MCPFRRSTVRVRTNDGSWDTQARDAGSSIRAPTAGKVDGTADLDLITKPKSRQLLGYGTGPRVTSRNTADYRKRAASVADPSLILSIPGTQD
jgi:hypothetical protein